MLYNLKQIKPYINIIKFTNSIKKTMYIIQIKDFLK